MSIPDRMISDDEDPSFEVSLDVLTRRMKKLNSVINHFWKRWKFEYLLELCNHHKNKTWAKNHQSIVKGDVVMIKSADDFGGWV